MSVQLGSFQDRDEHVLVAERVENRVAKGVDAGIFRFDYASQFYSGGFAGYHLRSRATGINAQLDGRDARRSIIVGLWVGIR